jgi:predicted transcriptional regulator of viral defense system
MRLAAAQHGAITAAQLAAAGIGRRAIARRLADGRLQRVHRGVYLAGPVQSPHARASAALLAAGPTAVLSHRSAAELWELLAPARGPIELTATERRPRSRQNIVVHTTASLPQSDIRRRHRLPLTSPERTLVDLATVLDAHALERAVEEAQVRRLANPGTLAAAVERHRGRPGAPRWSRRSGRTRPRSPAPRQSAGYSA